jgi:hypothetical protein
LCLELSQVVLEDVLRGAGWLLSELPEGYAELVKDLSIFVRLLTKK